MAAKKGPVDFIHGYINTGEGVWVNVDHITEVVYMGNNCTRIYLAGAGRVNYMVQASIDKVFLAIKRTDESRKVYMA